MTPPSAKEHKAMMEALHDLKTGMQGIGHDVNSIKGALTAQGAQLAKIDGNLNGDGSLADPGIAGEVRSLVAWKEADKPKVVALEAEVRELKAWRTNQAALWRQAFAWINVPMGVIGIVMWLANMANSHHAGGPPIK